MTEPDDLDLRVRDALARSASDVAVGPPPLAELHEAARVRRHSGRLRVAAASLVTAVVVGGGVVAVAVLPDRAPDAVDVDDGAAEGRRLVGVGRLGVWVPEEWGDAELGCGTPLTSGIVREDGGPVCLAHVPRPDDVVSVTVSDSPSAVEFAERTIVDPEVPVGRTAVTCEEVGDLDGDGTTGNLCRGWATDGQTGSVRVESSEADLEHARATVQSLLDGVELLPDGKVAVPTVGIAHPSGSFEPPAELYADAVAELGLVPQIVEELVPGLDAGRLHEIQPAPGTIVGAGATVTATVTLPPTALTDFYAVSATLTDGTAAVPPVTDAGIRAGDARVDVPVGDTVDVSASSGVRDTALTFDSDALQLTSSNSEVAQVSNRWISGDVVAVAPGTAEITVEIVIDGVVVPIGSFTVEVL